MIMKKIFALLLATLMVFSLAACGKGNADSDDKKDYSKLSTTDKITYILGEISDEPDTAGHYINELIGIRIALEGYDTISYDLKYPTKVMKETDYTKEYLTTIESQERITVFSAKDTYDSLKIEIIKMPQAEIDKLDIETYLKEIKGEEATIHRGKVAGVPVYYTSEQYGDYTSGCFFVIKCDGYLAEFSANIHDTGAYLFDKIRPIETTIKTVEAKDSKLQELYNSYQKISNIGEIVDNNKFMILSETDDKDNEVKRVYGISRNFSKETMIMYKPENNTISIVSVDAGFYDDYSFEDGTIVEFDKNNNPVRVTDSEGETNTYIYDEEGYLIEGIGVEYEYSADRKTIIALTKIEGKYIYKYNDKDLLIEKKRYVWDSAAGWNNDEEAHWDYSTGWTYEYDNQNRLIKINSINEDGTQGGYHIIYKYDSLGNVEVDTVND